MTRFYKIYLALIIVFLIALGLFLFHLNWWIEDYNETLPETISESFFNWVFEDLDNPKFGNAFTISMNEFEADWGEAESRASSTALEHMRRAVGDSPSFEETFRFEGCIGYSVTSNGLEIATFTLTKNEREMWQAGNLDVKINIPKQELTIKALSSSKVYINGTEVSKSYITGTEPHFSEGYLPEWVEGEKYVIYSIRNGFINTPSVSILDRNGKHPTLSEVDGVLVENVIYDIPDTETWSWILDAAINIELHKRHIVPLSAVTPYIEEDTALYEETKALNKKAVNRKYELKESKVFDLFRYDEETFSIRTSFILVTDKEELIDITYYARKIDGKYYIYAYKNNSEANVNKSSKNGQ